MKRAAKSIFDQIQPQVIQTTSKSIPQKITPSLLQLFDSSKITFTEIHQHLNTLQDSLFVLDKIAEMRSSKNYPSLTDSTYLLAVLLQKKHYTPLFTAFCDRLKYGLIPNRSQMDLVFQGHAAIAIQAKTLESLDQLYKCFALYLHFNMPPTELEYHALIDAGLKSELEEGKRRSIITAKEMISLGMNLDSKYAHLISL